MKEFRPTEPHGFGGSTFEWDLAEPAYRSDTGLILPGDMGWRRMGTHYFVPEFDGSARHGHLMIARDRSLRAELGHGRAELGRAGDFTEVILTINRAYKDNLDTRFTSWLLLDRRDGELSVQVRLDDANRTASGAIEVYDDWEQLREVALIQARLVADTLGVEIRELRQIT